jgi:hypothetical protein
MVRPLDSFSSLFLANAGLLETALSIALPFSVRTNITIGRGHGVGGVDAFLLCRSIDHCFRSWQETESGVIRPSLV